MNRSFTSGRYWVSGVPWPIRHAVKKAMKTGCASIGPFARSIWVQKLTSERMKECKESGEYCKLCEKVSNGDKVIRDFLIENPGKEGWYFTIDGGPCSAMLGRYLAGFDISAEELSQEIAFIIVRENLVDPFWAWVFNFKSGRVRALG